MILIGFLAPQVWSYISLSQSKMNRKDKLYFFYLVNYFVIQVVQPEASWYIYIHTKKAKRKKKKRRMKTGIQLHTYVYILHIWANSRLVYVNEREWYLVVNYCSISHLDVENGFIYFDVYEDIFVEVKSNFEYTHTAGMNNDDGHNCVFVHSKKKRKEKEIDLSHLLLFIGVHTSWFLLSLSLSLSYRVQPKGRKWTFSFSLSLRFLFL